MTLCNHEAFISAAVGQVKDAGAEIVRVETVVVALAQTGLVVRERPRLLDDITFGRYAENPK